MLVNFYDAAKAADPDGLEIVFISADSDDGQFQSYFGTMPWQSTVYGSDANEDINAKFDIAGIPMFIVLDGETGAVKDKQGRGTVSSNKGDVGACFSAW